MFHIKNYRYYPAVVGVSMVKNTIIERIEVVGDNTNNGALCKFICTVRDCFVPRNDGVIKTL